MKWVCLFLSTHTPHNKHFGVGMGKTIQAISLLLTNRPPDGYQSPEPPSTLSEAQRNVLDRWSAAEIDNERTVDPPRRAGTLVICPLVALHQWKSEILRFSRPGSLRVVIYHGPQRALVADHLQEADVVITSYQVVESEFRKVRAPAKVQCPICGKRLYPDKLRIHRM